MEDQRVVLEQARERHHREHVPRLRPSEGAAGKQRGAQRGCSGDVAGTGNHPCQALKDEVTSAVKAEGTARSATKTRPHALEKGMVVWAGPMKRGRQTRRREGGTLAMSGRRSSWPYFRDISGGGERS